ncbi:3-oxoacyl-[acyl-carrier-protein] synthase 2 [Nocardiopsis dassonvillei]
MSVACGLGSDAAAVSSALAGGRHSISAVHRFDTSVHRAGEACQLPAPAGVETELAAAVRGACLEAGLDTGEQRDTPLFLALHNDPGSARTDHAPVLGGTSAAVAAACGFRGLVRTYTNACVASVSALIDAAEGILSGRWRRAVVAGAYLVTADDFALFDAGGALAGDGRVRAFSRGRTGVLLGDGVSAVVLERPGTSSASAPRALLEGWAQSGDAHHVSRPDPAGHGMARAIGAALRRAGAEPDSLDYVNAHGTGTAHNDPAEAAALHRALGSRVATSVPLSSTKTLHGHALVAAGLLELAVTVLSLENRLLPANSGYLGPDPECELDLVLHPRPVSRATRALSLNAAFGGANTALVIGKP